ncbi:MAG: MarR family transcriptional regulator [Candidatus Acidiferrales bacterium]
MPRLTKAADKTRRAFAACLDVLDVADWLRSEMSDHLEPFDLTLLQFRVMHVLYQEGPQYQREISRRFRCTKQSIAFVIKCLERKEWVRKTPSALKAGRAVLRAAKRGEQPPGRRIVLLRLTPEGRRHIAKVFSMHVKFVKATMRALEGRQQDTLSRLCRKLREGDPLRFINELMYRERERIDSSWHPSFGEGPVSSG